VSTVPEDFLAGPDAICRYVSWTQGFYATHFGETPTRFNRKKGANDAKATG